LDGASTTGANSQCYDTLTENSVPLYNRPYITVWPSTAQLSISFNTNQVGRTFQDRSYVFRGQTRPSSVSSSSTIWNLGYRGRRGNIVQTYPAVEYDFVPTNLTIDSNTYVHIQFCGSDFDQNENPNNGEGWQYSSRTNMVQIHSLETQFPMAAQSQTMWSATSNSTATAVQFGFVGITNFANCLAEPTNTNNGDTNNNVNNCGKLNSAPTRYDGGLLQFTKGTYHYVSTRNNNFSNRSQKGTIQVSYALTAGDIAGIVIGSVAGTGMMVGGAVLYAKKRPESKFARFFRKRGGETLTL